jgi:hypothetical protein
MCIPSASYCCFSCTNGKISHIGILINWSKLLRPSVWVYIYIYIWSLFEGRTIARIHVAPSPEPVTKKMELGPNGHGYWLTHSSSLINGGDKSTNQRVLVETSLDEGTTFSWMQNRRRRPEANSTTAHLYSTTVYTLYTLAHKYTPLPVNSCQ